MRILLLSKALVHGPYQKKCEELAAIPGVELTVAVPESWHEPRVGVQKLERRFTCGYQLVALPIALNGSHHLHYYPTLAKLVHTLRPDIFHIDEESFNLATFQAMRLGIRIGAQCCFYNYANIDRSYPPPFSWFERYNFQHAAHAFAANHEAQTILRRHGYQGPLTILPQFGVDPNLFAPNDSPNLPNQHSSSIIIGYLGRLVPEKGILDLIEALATLPPHVRLRLIGDGSQRQQLLERINHLQLTTRVELRPWARDVPQELQALDILVLPSHTTRNWKEQFGRILIEAMSCGIPVIGSSSGEIPHVIQDAGLIFQERSSSDLATKLQLLINNPALRRDYAIRGRNHVLENYTQAALARHYYEIYQAMLRKIPR
jgi:glycosyltransferase involved in cell wall biosynthesis